LKDWLKHHWRNKWGQSNINFLNKWGQMNINFLDHRSLWITVN
jgi:hypothetical protein